MTKCDFNISVSYTLIFYIKKYIKRQVLPTSQFFFLFVISMLLGYEVYDVFQNLTIYSICTMYFHILCFLAAMYISGRSMKG